MKVDEALDGMESMIRGDFDPEKPEKLGPFVRAIRKPHTPVTREQHLRLIGIVVEIGGDQIIEAFME